MANQRRQGHERRPRHQEKEQLQNPNVDWLRDGIDGEAINWAQKAGKHFKYMTTSQIRKFFGEVRRIQGGFDRYKSDIPMLRAQLAYAAGRNKNVKPFQKTFEPMLVEVGQDKARFNNFVKLLEATVAYHKYYGGKE